MKYKMLVTDLDNTLLNDNEKLSIENINAIKLAREKGVKIVLCSGRNKNSICGFARDLELSEKDNYVVSYNGSQIVDLYEEKKIFEKKIKCKDFKNIVRLANNKKTDILAYDGDYLYVEQMCDRAKFEQENLDVNVIIVNSLLDDIDFEVEKITFHGDHDVLEEIYVESEIYAKKTLNYFFARPDFLDYINIESNKGIATEYLANIYGYCKDEIICIGDSFNDLAMIKYAGLGVAVANSHDEIKEHANYITKNTNDEHAIKEVIEKFILDI